VEYIGSDGSTEWRESARGLFAFTIEVWDKVVVDVDSVETHGVGDDQKRDI
jgi:hypothetical protein